MAANKLIATTRTEFGKGAARRVRREGLIPAVLYGHGTEPRHVTLPGHEVFLIVRHSRNALLEVEIDGGSELALVKDVQVNPVIRQIEHMDLVLVRRGEKVTVNVPISVVGEPFAGTVASVELFELEVLAPAISIPEAIEVSVEGAEDGTIIRVGDLKLPEDVTTEIDPESPVVVVSTPTQTAEDVADEEAAETEGDAAPAEEAAASGV